jgi:hypothetical protein
MRYVLIGDCQTRGHGRRQACSTPPALASNSRSSGGSRSGRVASAPEAGSVGADPSRSDGLGAGTPVTAPTLEDSSRVDDPWAGVVEAAEVSQHTSRKIQNLLCTRGKLTV